MFREPRSCGRSGFRFLILRRLRFRGIWLHRPTGRHVILRMREDCALALKLRLIRRPFGRIVVISSGEPGLLALSGWVFSALRRKPT